MSNKKSQFEMATYQIRDNHSKMRTPMVEKKITIGISDDNAAALDSLEKTIANYLYTNNEEGNLLLFQIRRGREID